MDNDNTNPVKRCTKCGEEKPATAEYFSRHKRGKYGVRSQCKKCVALYQQSRKDYLREYEAAWRQKNPNKSREKTKRWRERNREQARENDRKRYWSNPEHARKRVQGYRKRNPDKVRAQYNAYKATAHGHAVVNKHAQIRRMRKRELQYELTNEQWQFCLNYFNHCCAICGKPAGLWSIIVQDHWNPVSKGGATIVTNIIPICHCLKDGYGCCNSAKSDSNPKIWLISRYGKHKAHEILKRINDYFKLVSRKE